MSRNLTNLILFSIAILSTISFFISDNNETIILPISSILVFTTLFADFYLTTLNIKKGTFIKIGKNKSKIWNSVMFLVIGIIWILLGTYGSHSYLHWKGIDNKIFLGILFISASILRIENYTILIKGSNIAFNDFMEQSEWSISKIDKVIMNNNNVSFFKNERKKEFIIDDYEMPKLKQFLKEKFNDRLIIE
jgi:hypothetical protein